MVETFSLRELLFRLKKDSNYLNRKTVKVLKYTGAKHSEVAGSTLTNFKVINRGGNIRNDIIHKDGSITYDIGLDFGTILEIKKMSIINLKEIYANY